MSFCFSTDGHTKKPQNQPAIFFLFGTRIALGATNKLLCPHSTVHTSRAHCHLCSLFLELQPHLPPHPQLCVCSLPRSFPPSPPPWICATRSRKARGETRPKQSSQREQGGREREKEQQTRSLASLSLSSTTPFSLPCTQHKHSVLSPCRPPPASSATPCPTPSTQLPPVFLSSRSKVLRGYK
jgi:hypothetical protein